MGRARRDSTVRCLSGRPIATELKPGRPEFLKSGYCHGCGGGPLHGPVGGNCDCSYLRGRFRLCRDCSIGFDYISKGSTRIRPPFTPEEWRSFIQIYDRGMLAMRGMADVIDSRLD